MKAPMMYGFADTKRMEIIIRAAETLKLLESATTSS
jgi:hypothetical protein